MAQTFTTTTFILLIQSKIISMQVVTGSKEFFKGIGQIQFEGIQSDNPLAFR